MLILKSPVLAILKDTKTGRFHPVFFDENPLPGTPAITSGPVRYESRSISMHGYALREEALVDVERARQALQDMAQATVRTAILPDDEIPWDGARDVGLIAFFPKAQEGETTTKRIL